MHDLIPANSLHDFIPADYEAAGRFQGVPQAELDYIMDRLDADETELSRRHLAAAS